MGSLISPLYANHNAESFTYFDHGDFRFNSMGPVISCGFRGRSPANTGLGMLDVAGTASLAHMSPYENHHAYATDMLDYYRALRVGLEDISAVVAGVDARDVGLLVEFLKSNFVRVVGKVLDERIGPIAMAVDPTSRKFLIHRHPDESYELPFD